MSTGGRTRSLRKPIGGRLERTTAVALICVVGLLLLGRVAFAAHMLLVPHLVGADGTLVHQGSHGESRCSGEGELVTLGDPSARTADDGDAERCDVLGIKEAPPTTQRPHAPVRLLGWRLLAPAAPRLVDAAGLPLLSLAPKLSPPFGATGR